MLLLAVLYVRIGFLLRRDAHQNDLPIETSEKEPIRSPLSRLESPKATSARHESKEATEGRKRTIKVLCECSSFFPGLRLIFNNTFCLPIQWLSWRIFSFVMDFFMVSDALNFDDPCTYALFYSC